MRQSHKIVNIDDLRTRAKARLPKIFFDYIDGGAFSETTMKRNRSDFERWELVQHVWKKMSQTRIEHERMPATT